MPIVKSKVKLSRSLGIPLTPKAARRWERRPDPPGQHGRSRNNRKKSDFGLQLLEKQRLRHQYFLRERQLANYVRKAAARMGNTVDHLIHALETRLDAIVLRAGFARTIYQARQFVTHGHVLINDRRVSFPSAPVRVGDVISLHPNMRDQNDVAQSIETIEPPSYIERNGKEFSARLIRLPSRDEIPVICELSSVVEFYAK